MLLVKPNNVKNLKIGYLALLALVGAFLAKGSLPPFGGVYLWLFRNIPGMSLFRDAAKFFLLLVLSFHPNTLHHTYTHLWFRPYHTLDNNELHLLLHYNLKEVSLASASAS